MLAEDSLPMPGAVLVLEQSTGTQFLRKIGRKLNPMQCRRDPATHTNVAIVPMSTQALTKSTPINDVHLRSVHTRPEPHRAWLADMFRRMRQDVFAPPVAKSKNRKKIQFFS
jgi:hypothetical protein